MYVYILDARLSLEIRWFDFFVDVVFHRVRLSRLQMRAVPLTLICLCNPYTCCNVINPISVLGQIMRAPIQLQCIFSYSFVANPASLVFLSIFPFAFECEMNGGHCLSMWGLPVIFLLNNVFSDEWFEKCSTFNGSVCGCVLISWINNGNYRI